MSIYTPNNEPEDIKVHLNRFISELNEAFPYGVIFTNEWKHDKWDSMLKWLCKSLGYSSGQDFLQAYGFSVDRQPASQTAMAKTKSVKQVQKGESTVYNVSDIGNVSSKMKGWFSICGGLLGAGIILFFIGIISNGNPDTSTAGVIVFLVGLAALYIVLKITTRLVCPKCKSTSFSVVKKVETKKETVYRSKTMEEKTYPKNKNSNTFKSIPVYSTKKTVQVPATKHYYTMTYRCNKCGACISRNETKTIG